MSLKQIQALMWQAITWPTGIDDFLAQAPVATQLAFAQTFAETPQFSRRERLQVYAEAYFYRLASVLREQFELTAWILGPRRFHNLATDYVLQYPSTDPDIGRFGIHLSDMLCAHPFGRTIDGLAELCSIEWTIHRMIHAPDEPILHHETLAAMPPSAWPTMQLMPQSTLRLLPCPLALAELRQRFRAGEPCPSPLPLAGPGPIVVWRCGFEVFHRRLDPNQAMFLARLQAGDRFGDVCEAAAIAGEDMAMIVRWLQAWIHDGMLASLKTI